MSSATAASARRGRARSRRLGAHRIDRRRGPLSRHPVRGRRAPCPVARRPRRRRSALRSVERRDGVNDRLGGDAQEGARRARQVHARCGFWRAAGRRTRAATARRRAPADRPPQVEKTTSMQPSGKTTAERADRRRSFPTVTARSPRLPAGEPLRGSGSPGHHGSGRCGVLFDGDPGAVKPEVNCAGLADSAVKTRSRRVPAATGNAMGTARVIRSPIAR